MSSHFLLFMTPVNMTPLQSSFSFLKFKIGEREKEKNFLREKENKNQIHNPSKTSFLALHLLPRAIKS